MRFGRDARAVAEMATHSPLSAACGAALDTNVSEGPGPASEGPAPALRSSRLRATTRSSRISRAFPPGGYAPPVSPDGTCEKDRAKVAAHHELTDAGQIGQGGHGDFPVL